MYIESRPFGNRGKGSQGENFYTAPNPALGAVFTYHLKEGYKTRKQARQKAEEKATKENLDIRYPDWDELKVEDNEVEPYLIFTIFDEDGYVVNRLKSPAKKGIHRKVWGFRYPAITPARITKSGTGRYSYPDNGMYALPGNYFVSLSKVVDDIVTELVSKQPFVVKSLESGYITNEARRDLASFQKDLNKLRRVLQGVSRIVGETDTKIKLIRVAIEQSPKSSDNLRDQAKELEEEIKEIKEILYGNRTISSRNYNTPPTLYGRVETIIYSQWRTSGPSTITQKESYRIALKEFEPLYIRLKKLLEKDIVDIEAKLEKIKAPYTPGRFPDWELD